MAAGSALPQLPGDRDARQTLVHSILDPVLEHLRVTGTDGGYAGGVANDDMTAVTIYWKGPVPTPLRDAVNRSRRTFPIEIKPARFSGRDLQQATRAIRAVWSDQWGDFMGLRSKSDASGFSVRKSSRGQTAGQVASLLVDRLPSWGPFDVVISPPTVPTAVWRWNDTSPWNPGGARTASGNGWCSIAFAVGKKSDGAKRILSAGHCGQNNSNTRDGTGNEIIGQVFVAQGIDAALIAANGSTNVFVGANEDDQNGPTLTVTGFGYNITGDHVCTSGANSGEHCDVVVRDSMSTDGWGNSYVHADPSDESRVVVVQGDSGGPVIVRGLGSSATARGMIIEAGDLVSCTAADYHVGPALCGNDVYYYPIAALLTRFDLRMDL